MLAANPWRHSGPAAHATCHGAAGGERQGPRETRIRHAVAQAPRVRRMNACPDGVPQYGKTVKGPAVATAPRGLRPRSPPGGGLGRGQGVGRWRRGREGKEGIGQGPWQGRGQRRQPGRAIDVVWASRGGERGGEGT
jgi:hypothetical protein